MPSITRIDGRQPDQLRPVTITPNFQAFPAGSVLIECGRTRVICAASVEERVPPFLLGLGKGWVTAEYSMLPSSTPTRSQREGAGSRLAGLTAQSPAAAGSAEPRLYGHSVSRKWDRGEEECRGWPEREHWAGARDGGSSRRHLGDRKLQGDAARPHAAGAAR